MQHIIPMELTDVNSSIPMKLRPTYGGLPEYGTAEGDIASFITNINYPLKKLEADIVAQQDLHGYDYPWAGGAGKNKLPFDLDEVKSMNTYVGGSWSGNVYTRLGLTYTVNSDGTIKINGTATDNAEFRVGVKNIHSFLVADTPYILNGCPAGGGYGTTYRLAITDNITNTWADDGAGASFTPNSAFVGNNYFVAINVYSGYTANNIVFKPMIRLASVSDATWEPYENICPIVGYDEIEVNVSGTNIWDEEWEQGALSIDNGTTIFAVDRVRSKNFISVIAGETYYCHFPVFSGANNINDIIFYDVNRTYVGYENPRPSRSFPITIPANCAYIKFHTNPQYGGTYNHDISINYPSTETAYHKYVGNTYTTDLDGTRYGGTLNVTTGVLTIDKGYVDLGTLTWIAEADLLSGQFRASNTPSNIKFLAELLCSNYKGVQNPSYNSLLNGEISVTNSQAVPILRVRDESKNNLTDEQFKTAMSGVQLVYELATPQTYQLSPQEVETVVGQNYIWANSGQVYVEYHFVEDFE